MFDSYLSASIIPIGSKQISPARYEYLLRHAVFELEDTPREEYMDHFRIECFSLRFTIASTPESRSFERFRTNGVFRAVVTTIQNRIREMHHSQLCEFMIKIYAEPSRVLVFTGVIEEDARPEELASSASGR